MGFDLTPRQREALTLLNGPQRNTLLVGGARSGKTTEICLVILVRALKAPGSRHGVFRFRANAVWSSIGLDTMPKVARLNGIPLSVNKQDRFFYLPERRVGARFERSEIWLGGLDDKERVEKILGLEFATIYKNEASQIPYASHLMLSTRLAQVCDGIRQRDYTDLNPCGTAHWTYRLFVQKVDPDTRRPLANPDDYASFFMNPRDNAANLSPEFLRSLESLPERQRKRFFDGSYQSEIDGALWTLETIDRCRLDDATALPDMRRVVVAIDPSGTGGEEGTRSDDVGIVVAGLGVDGKGYVLADRTCNLPPAGWGRRAVDAYHQFRADSIVAERNYGGAMVRHVIRTTESTVPFREVVASRGKVVRAEPVSALYEQDMVRHAGRFPELEDQLSNFSTAGYLGDRSPDRADAMVWALTDLMLGSGAVVFASPIVVTTPSPMFGVITGSL